MDDAGRLADIRRGCRCWEDVSGLGVGGVSFAFRIMKCVLREFLIVGIFEC